MKTIAILFCVVLLSFTVPALAQSPIPTPTVPTCAIGESGPECAPYRPPLSPLPIPASPLSTPAPPAVADAREPATAAPVVALPATLILLPETGSVLWFLLLLCAVALLVLICLYRSLDESQN